MIIDQELISRIFLMILLPFIFVVLIMPYIKKMAIKIGAVDVPRNRHMHKKTTPKLGGLAIFFGFLLGYMVFGTHSSTMNAILIGSFIIVIIGVIDDIAELSAKTQFIGQVAAACVIVFYGNILLQDISAFGIYINFSWMSYPLTLFLVYNYHPASIFAGDTGSNLMGFMISIVALLGFKNVTMTSLIIPLLVMAIPILDTLFAIIRRVLKGQNPFTSPDRFHIHHQLLNKNFSEKSTVSIILGIDLLFASASIIYVLGDEKLGYIVYGILLAIVLAFVLTTNVITDRETVKKTLNRLKRSK